MNNSTFKNSIFKRTIILAFCLVVGLGFSNFFFLSKNNSELNVHAQTIEQIENENYLWSLDFKDSNNQTTNNNSISTYATIPQATYSYEIPDDLTFILGSLEGGSKIKWVANADTQYPYSIWIKPTNVGYNQEYEVKVTPKAGYKIENCYVKLGNSSNKINLSSLFYRTLEDLDPDYTGTIQIYIETRAIDYATKIYYQEYNNGTYSWVYERFYYDVEGHELPTSGYEPTNKKLKGWYFDSARAYDDLYGQFVFTTDASNKYIQIALKDDPWNPVIYFKYSDKIETDERYNGIKVCYYKIESIKGVADFTYDSYPYIFANYTNTYTANIHQGYDDGGEQLQYRDYWKTLGFNGNDLIDLRGINNLTKEFHSESKNKEKLSETKGLAFSKKPAVSLDVYNFGFYIKEWYITATYNGTNIHLDSNYYSTSTNLKDIAKELDEFMLGKEGIPLIDFYPIWKPVSFQISYDTSSKWITFTKDYDLTDAVPTSSGQTFFAFAKEDQLVAPKAIWNYTTIKPTYISISGIYRLTLNSVCLDNVYKASLSEMESDSTGNFKLGEGLYSFNNTYNGKTSNVYTYSDLAGSITAYNSADYPLVDEYVKYLDGYKTSYEKGINKDGNDDYQWLNKIYYSGYTTATDDQTLKNKSQDMWIYLAYNQPTGTMPRFETEYFSTLLWLHGGTGYITSLFEEKYFAETNNAGIALELDTWKNSSEGVSLTAYNLKKIHLYYDDENKTSFDYITGVAYGTYEEVSLDVTKIGTNITCGNLKSFGRWFFDVDTAKNQGYTIEILSTSIKATKDGNTTQFSYNETYLNLYYITKVWGDVFYQSDPSKPIIRHEWINKYNFIIDNSGTEDGFESYWTNFDLTKSDSSLYGAVTSGGTQLDDFRIQVVAANLSDYNFKFYNSTANNKGLAFQKRKDFKDSEKIKADNNVSYYVYSYGQYVSGWEIYFEIPGLDQHEIAVNNLGSFYLIESRYNGHIDNLKLTSKTFKNICKVIDSYLASLGYVGELPSVTMIPIWSSAEVIAKYAGTTLGSIYFGDSYTLIETSVSNGKTLFSYQDSKKAMVAVDALWNYQNLTGYSGRNASSYTIELTPVGLDNVYSIELIDVTKNQADVFELDTGFTFYSNSGLFNNDEILTYNELKDFSEFDNNEYNLVDDYISYLARYIEGYKIIIEGEHEVFNYVYYSAGALNNGNLSGDNVQFHIYLANEQKINNMPRFKHDLSMLIYWQNDVTSHAYITESFDDLYRAELQKENNSSFYSISETWERENGISISARYVYSVRMYYNTGAQYDGSVKSEYFGRYFKTPDLNANFKAPQQSDRVFNGWMFDRTVAEQNLYNVTENGNKLIVTENENGEQWEFEFIAVNAFNSNLYYITNVQGYGRFLQDQNNPIIKVKWTHLYNLIIDNTNTYWNNVGVQNESQYGAVSNASSENFNQTTLEIANLTGYEYSYLDSEAKDGTGLSFYHLTDWVNAEGNEGAWSIADNGYYYVYNYGHYIAGWYITFTLSNISYFIEYNNNSTGIIFESTGNPEYTLNTNLTMTNFKNLSALVDEFSEGETIPAVITIKPYWEEAKIDFYVDEEFKLSSSDGVLSSKSFAEQYNFSTTVTKPSPGQSIIAYYYGDNVNSLIAFGGVWNYKDIASVNYNSYNRDSTVVVGGGTYLITLKPYYVDNIYRVKLDNAKVFKSGEYKLTNCDYKFNSEDGAYAMDAEQELTFNNVDYFVDGVKYQFKEYDNQILMDDYINKVLIDCIIGFEYGINPDSGSYFDIFRKVYYKDVIPGWEVSQELDVLKVVPNNAPEFIIYLANGQKHGALPVFKKDYYSLIFWQNSFLPDNGDWSYVYTTNEYEPELHSEEILNKSYHVDEEDNWYFEDGHDDKDVVFNAYYYRKNYKVDISTINFENQQIERRGYVRFTITDILYAEDNTIDDCSGDYLIIFNGLDAMVIHKYNGILKLNWDSINNKYKTMSFDEIRLYEGCDVVMNVYDQSKDPDSMATGDFDDMIGYKFNQNLVQSIVTTEGVVRDDAKEFFGHVNDDQYSYSIDAEGVKDKEYQNKDVICIAVCFERIKYTVNFEIDNVKAGELSVTENKSISGLNTTFTLDNVSVQNNYKIDYYAYAGYKLESDAFVIRNGLSDYTLQSYNENTGNIVQDYVLTKNFYGDSTLDGTWLRLYFYKDYIDYDVNRTTVGTLFVMTCPIDFTLGIKIYDPTDSAFATNDYIIETPISFNTSFILQEFTGEGLTPEIYTYLTTETYNFYHYKSTSLVPYALISSRMFYPKDPTTQIDNFYLTYSFLLNKQPKNQAKLISNNLSSMVENFEEGKIISISDRNIYIMLEVRKLLTIDMRVAQLEHDTNGSIRSTILSNADNNNVEIKVNPNAERVDALTYSTSPIKGFYKVAQSSTNTQGTIVRAYTYFGLENNLSSIFDNVRYKQVEYYLNDYILENNQFIIEQNAELEIRYIPNCLNVNFVYMIDGDSITDPLVIAEYIEEDLNYKPLTTIKYYAEDGVTYSVRCVHEDYNIEVLINEISYGTTSTDVRSIELIDDAKYIVSDIDFVYGSITIVVNIKLQDHNSINVKFQLYDMEKLRSTDDYGTFTVFENDQIKAENVKEENIVVIAGRDVYVSLDIPVGYKYVGIKHNMYSAKNPQIDQDGKILMIEEFNPQTDFGTYLILLDKISIQATLITNGGNSNTNNVHKDSTYLINEKYYLEGLYVGDEILFTANPAEQEEYYNFYYLKKDNSKNHLVDETGNALTQITLTSELLKEVNNIMIIFGVSVEQKFKLDLIVAGEEFIKSNSLQMKVYETEQEYISGTYVVKGTIIDINLETIVEGKYNINFLENNYDIISFGTVMITLDQDLELLLKVEPKGYRVESNYNLYTTLNGLHNNQPDLNNYEDLNQISQTGYLYGSRETLSIYADTGREAIHAIHISNNDFENEIIILFNKSTYISYVVIDNVNQEINLNDYQINFAIKNNIISFEYLVQSDMEITFEYKDYKVISS